MPKDKALIRQLNRLRVFDPDALNLVHVININSIQLAVYSCRSILSPP